MTDYRELLLGCGHSREKRMDPRDFDSARRRTPDDPRHWRGQVETLDSNIDVHPDMVCDLTVIPWAVHERENGSFLKVLPNATYDEIHAYEVLEHLGRQGDYRSFFGHFAEIWRLLKPGGYLCATCPSRYSQWLWGDPGHTRAILPAHLVFLHQPNYAEQCGKTSMSDYRRVYRADFDLVGSVDDHETHRFVLQAVKPSRATAS